MGPLTGVTAIPIRASAGKVVEVATARNASGKTTIIGKSPRRKRSRKNGTKRIATMETTVSTGRSTLMVTDTDTDTDTDTEGSRDRIQQCRN